MTTCYAEYVRRFENAKILETRTWFTYCEAIRAYGWGREAELAQLTWHKAHAALAKASLEKCWLYSERKNRRENKGGKS